LQDRYFDPVTFMCSYVGNIALCDVIARLQE
jgi:hypothetical protein